MLTLSGASDRVVIWSDVSLQRKKVRKLTGFVEQFFLAFTRFCHFNYMLVLCVC